MKSLEFEEQIRTRAPHRCNMCGNVMPAGSEMIQQEYSCWTDTGIDRPPAKANPPVEYQYACVDCHRFATDVERIQAANAGVKMQWDDVVVRLESLKRLALARAQADMEAVTRLKRQPEEGRQYDEEGLDFTYRPDAG